MGGYSAADVICVCLLGLRSDGVSVIRVSAFIGSRFTDHSRAESIDYALTSEYYIQ